MFTYKSNYVVIIPLNFLLAFSCLGPSGPFLLRFITISEPVFFFRLETKSNSLSHEIRMMLSLEPRRKKVVFLAFACHALIKACLAAGQVERNERVNEPYKR